MTQHTSTDRVRDDDFFDDGLTATQLLRRLIREALDRAHADKDDRRKPVR